MKVTVDSGGRVLIPKSLREQFGIKSGTEVDVTPYGGGLHLSLHGRGGRVERVDGHLVIRGSSELTDDVMYTLIDASRQ